MSPTETPQILVVDDARDIREPLALFLRKESFRTRTAANAEEARAILDEAVIHLAIVDIMMPGESGLELCQWLSANKGPPVILLTASTDEDQIIEGLGTGADDYVTKPFSPRELLARIRAVLRRKPATQPEQTMARRAFGGLIHDASARRVILPDGAEVELTSGENRLLGAMLDHPQQILSRARLLDLIRGREAKAYDRAVDNTVSRLRRKIGDDLREARLLVTEWGGGYRLACAVEELS